MFKYLQNLLNCNFRFLDSYLISHDKFDTFESLFWVNSELESIAHAKAQSSLSIQFDFSPKHLRCKHNFVRESFRNGSLLEPFSDQVKHLFTRRGKNSFFVDLCANLVVDKIYGHVMHGFAP